MSNSGEPNTSSNTSALSHDYYDSAIPHVIGHALSTIIKITLQKHVINQYLEPYKNNKYIAFINNHSESLLEITEGFLLGAIRAYNSKKPKENILFRCCSQGIAQASLICIQELIIQTISLLPITTITKTPKNTVSKKYYAYGALFLGALVRLGIQSTFLSCIFRKPLLSSGTVTHRIQILNTPHTINGLYLNPIDLINKDTRDYEYLVKKS